MGSLQKPWTYQVELVEGCNRICHFCGINSIRSAPGNYRYMTEATLGQVAAQIADYTPDTKVSFAMHGEPLQHPRADAMLALARGLLPRAQFTLVTNGRVMMGRMQARLERVFAVGVDMVMLDTYYPERDDLHREVATLQDMTVVHFYDEPEKMQRLSPYQNHHRKLQRLLIVVDDLAARAGESVQRKIHNHAGGNPTAPTVAAPLAKTCTKPFRELTIEWDGTVNLCCEDWLRRYVLGNVHQQTIPQMWGGPEIEAARAMLQNKRRDFAGCAVCDADAGMRAGLLPKYGPVTPEQEATVRAVEARSGRVDLVQLRTSKPAR